MLWPVAMTTFLIGSLLQSPVLGSGNFDYDEGLFCTHDHRVEVFASSFFAGMLVEHGQDVVFSVQASGSVAAKSEYYIVLDILQKEGMCSAEWVAYTASQPFRSEDTVNLEGYLQKTGHTVGQFLLDQGLLECDNSISISLDFFALVRAAFKGLDENKLESYQRGVLQALVDFIHEHGLNLEDAASDLSYSFYKEFKSSHKGDCKKSDSK